MSGSVNLGSAPVDELVALFATTAIEQGRALRLDTKRYGRLYHRMDKITEELKSRSDDRRRSLMPLYRHPNPTVRFKAAMATLATATLALAPMEARQVLQIIKDRKEFPIAANASQMLDALDEGGYVPT